jgi:hypothetical protein
MLDVSFKNVAYLKDHASFKFITLEIFTCLLINTFRIFGSKRYM